ncbi:hypothetical protein RRG08_016643 [Elysia crispata]|uniref:Secreted protein n=1 Tax=Elysia crispata TaxID=231223 RepID=A0AAE0YWP7_9GAST|nr:hypothetical protein RRG08_016643 [Elysia crispata]
MLGLVTALLLLLMSPWRGRGILKDAGVQQSDARTTTPKFTKQNKTTGETSTRWSEGHLRLTFQLHWSGTAYDHQVGCQKLEQTRLSDQAGHLPLVIADWSWECGVQPLRLQ